ncbi:MIT domain-containing protein 1 [Trichonephila inaurata madagascariensis]|uniref:MIT domain-containing protein 1 n=1 Tax=Trichonephila inaurata madagascariensis TaxID=2747483 RepID=A0A8X7CAB4_9ARAC|nr:MIT domain-containing protein 1 [Trichonephila inaurata madagascariensis]
MSAKKYDNNVLDGMEQAAITMICRAVQFDNDGKYSSALSAYQEGIHVFLDVIKITSDKRKQELLRQKATEYITRAEKIKDILQRQKDAGNYHEQIQIPNDGVGFSYESLFKKYLDKTITNVKIEDPYIRNVHQAYNFLSFCELLVRYCPELKKIILTTGANQQDHVSQMSRFNSIRNSLASYNIELEIIFSDTLHDREIRLGNGWILKIGRGLDFFKPVNKFSIGFSDQSLRPCHETTVDIYFKQQ